MKKFIPIIKGNRNTNAVWCPEEEKLFIRTKCANCEREIREVLNNIASQEDCDEVVSRVVKNENLCSKKCEQAHRNPIVIQSMLDRLWADFMEKSDVYLGLMVELNQLLGNKIVGFANDELSRLMQLVSRIIILETRLKLAERKANLP